MPENTAILAMPGLWEVLLRLLTTMLFSGILGYEREVKQRPAGFRTYIVVGLGSALAMLTGICLYSETGNGDPGRIAAQVISGIGFLGAGTILVTRQHQVKGLTTAAGLWSVACLGLALGAGFYLGATVCFIGLWCSMRFMQVVDKRIVSHARSLSLHVLFEGPGAMKNFIAVLRNENMKMKKLEISQVIEQEGTALLDVSVQVVMAKNRLASNVLNELSQLDGVLYLEEI